MEKGTIYYRKITETYGKLIMKNYGNTQNYRKFGKTMATHGQL